METPKIHVGTMEDPAAYTTKQEGRPRKDPEDKRSKILKCYVTQAEKETLVWKCDLAGMSISDFLRDLALNKEIRVTANPEDLKSIRSNLGRVTGLLNQIAAKSNSGVHYSKEMLDGLCDEIRETLQEL